MKYKKIVLMLVLAASGFCSRLDAEPGIRGDFVIFTSYTGNSVYDEILRGGETALLDVCSAAGRMIPVEYNYKKAAIEKSGGADRDALYRNTALYLKADLYAVISSYNENGDYVLKLRLIPLGDRYKDLNCEKTVRSRIAENIPLKAAREFAGLLKGIKLTCDVMQVHDDGSAVINSGQWHGLETGSYTTGSGKIKVKNVSRYVSLVQGRDFKAGETIDFKTYPDLDGYIKKINYEIRENTVRNYGTDEALDKRDGRIKESIKGTCVINQGANFCLPGYGSYLSLDYMGIENGKPDYAGIVLSASLTAVHLGLVPALTDFNVNFFPWIEDSARSGRMKRLNYFLWGTLPLTFTSSFFSQLVYNYREKNLLPPQFADYDMSAAVVSLFVPGGGLFYKGYRWSGWGVYLGEMSLAGYAVYTEEGDKRNLLLGSLAVFKCAEIIASYFIPSSYDVFNREVSSSGDVNFSLGLRENDRGDHGITASVSLLY